MEEKPTPEQLQEYFKNDRAKFDSIANHYRENDTQFYLEHIHPLYIKERSIDSKYKSPVFINAKQYDVKKMDYSVLPVKRKPVIPKAEYVNPVYSQLRPGEIECPYCHQKVYPYHYATISTSGWAMIIMGTLLTPVIIGIIFVIAGTRMKNIHSGCPRCGIRYN